MTIPWTVLADAAIAALAARGINATLTDDSAARFLRVGLGTENAILISGDHGPWPAGGDHPYRQSGWVARTSPGSLVVYSASSLDPAPLADAVAAWITENPMAAATPTEPSSTVELVFDLAEVVRLAEDSAAATRRRTRPSDDDFTVQVDAGVCLMLVRDEGVYLMSTNAADDRLPPVYAYGFHPDWDWYQRWLATGLPGDDFAEYFELDKSGLLASLRRAAGDRYRHFVVIMTEQHLSLAFDTVPADRLPPAT